MGIEKHSLTDEQIKDAMEQAGQIKADAARLLGVPRTTLLGYLERRDIGEGLLVEAPSGYNVKGVSAYQTLVNGEWIDTRRWVKTDRDKENVEALQNALEERFKATPARPIVKAPKARKSDLLTVYPLGDPHVGMLAWAQEGGDDFDLKIAAHDLIAASTRLVDSAPDGPCLIAQLGDFFHADSQAQKTEKSGNRLDCDSRYGKILEVGVDLMCSLIDMALAKHATVHVINARGNHDPQTAMVLTIALKHHYRKNKRVTFGGFAAYFHYHQHGETLLGITHGDGPKPTDLGEIMSTDDPVAWGATRHRYWLTGHIHTRSVYELRGCMVESFRTLAAKDAWTAQMGYRSGRDMYRIVYDKTHGEVERQRVDIGMVQ